MQALIKQKSYERIIYVLRHHWLTFIPRFTLFIVLLSVPVLLYFMVSNIFPNLLGGPISYPLFVLAACSYYLSLYVFFFSHFIEFYLDITIITNDRIIDVEQLSLFSRSISELDLFRIQDVTTDVHGPFATFFNYGTVSIKTASTNVNITAVDVPHPNKVREELIHLAHEDRKYHAKQPGVES